MVDQLDSDIIFEEQLNTDLADKYDQEDLQLEFLNFKEVEVGLSNF